MGISEVVGVGAGSSAVRSQQLPFGRRHVVIGEGRSR